jgi:septal ring factor EnvC (AmiA/AmiB activator)
MWWWVMIWVLLLVGAGVYLGVRSWGLWGQTKELGSELATAQRRLDEVQGQLELLGEQIGSAEELAVFASPAAARRERDRARSEGREARQQRRAASRPAWAKHVD